MLTHPFAQIPDIDQEVSAMSKATAADALQMYLDGYTEGEIMEQISVPPSEYEMLITKRVAEVHRSRKSQRAEKLDYWTQIIAAAQELVRIRNGKSRTKKAGKRTK